MAKTVVLEWSCDKCSMVIRSIYPNQFKHNIEEHKKTHEGGR